MEAPVIDAPNFSGSGSHACSSPPVSKLQLQLQFREFVGEQLKGT